MFSADKIQTIGVVGLGLIGGSFVKSFRKYSDKRILACDLDEGLVASAIEDEILDDAATDESIAECDLIIPALYPASLLLSGCRSMLTLLRRILLLLILVV